MDNLYKSIGEKLKIARDSSGLTQAQVEKLLGLNKTQLSYYENGKREISITILEKLSNLYGYQLNYFLKDEPDSQPTFKLSFRTSDLTEKDLEVIEWAKLFLNNLYDMNSIKNRM